LPDDVGSCVIDRLALDEGMSLVYSEYIPRCDLREASEFARSQPVLTIALGLEGCSGYVGEDGQAMRFQAGHATVTLSAQARGERRYRAGQRVRQLRLALDAQALGRLGLESLLAQPTPAPVHPLAFGSCSIAGLQLARQLRAADASDPLQRLDMRIAALGLLGEQARQLLVPVGAGPSLRPAVRERLRQAHAMMEAQFDRPLTVARLCREVGINEFDFKQGFTALFGCTPHRMLTQIRMRHAQQLLATGVPVAMVAWQVGFRHASSFSAAYRRHCGHPPSAVGRPAAEG